MQYYYQVYGIPLVSEIKLPALAVISEQENFENPVYIKHGKAPKELSKTPLEKKPFSSFNASEFLYAMPDVARYYVENGNQIIIEPHCNDWDTILLFFYSNCIAATLFQRDIIPFHVSGVLIDPETVLLFAAPSRTGKSTTAVMLQQKGYTFFTDDTAVLTVENGICYAQASYPMVRLWKNTIEQQTVLNAEEKHTLRSDVELNKFGFYFHDRFISRKVKVAGIVFLEEQGSDIVIEKIKPTQFIQLFGNNIYRNQWLAGMKKQVLQFKVLTTIANTIPGWKAIRPKGAPTFQDFAAAIEKQVITRIIEQERAQIQNKI